MEAAGVVALAQQHAAAEEEAMTTMAAAVAPARTRPAAAIRACQCRRLWRVATAMGG